MESGGLRAIAFDDEGKLAAVSMESKVQLWSVEDWVLASEVPVGTKVASALAFSPDGCLLAIGGADRKIRIWKIGE
jgi:WD40 repeat protein